MPRIAPATEWPAEALVWLGRAGVSVATAKAHGSGWAPSVERFMLRCAVDGIPTGGYTGRSLAPNRPKYVAGGSGMQIWVAGDGPLVVFVEDVLSAWKVHMAGFRACAVLGTSFGQMELGAALGGRTQVVAWLDPDAAGRKATPKLRKALGLWDISAFKTVVSERDPKLHSREEITRYIKETPWQST